MKNLLLIILLCGCNFFRMDFMIIQQHERCINDCKKYKYSKLIEGGIVLAGKQTPWCICMIDCMSDSNYCIDKQSSFSLPK